MCCMGKRQEASILSGIFSANMQQLYMNTKILRELTEKGNKAIADILTRCSSSLQGYDDNN